MKAYFYNTETNEIIAVHQVSSNQEAWAISGQYEQDAIGLEFSDAGLIYTNKTIGA